MDEDRGGRASDANPRCAAEVHQKTTPFGTRGGDRRLPLTRVVDNGRVTPSQETVGRRLLGHAVRGIIVSGWKRTPKVERILL